MYTDEWGNDESEGDCADDSCSEGADEVSAPRQHQASNQDPHYVVGTLACGKRVAVVITPCRHGWRTRCCDRELCHDYPSKKGLKDVYKWLRMDFKTVQNVSRLGALECLNEDDPVRSERTMQTLESGV